MGGPGNITISTAEELDGPFPFREVTGNPTLEQLSGRDQLAGQSMPSHKLALALCSLSKSGTSGLGQGSRCIGSGRENLGIGHHDGRFGLW
jgi:hypothetical protein